MTLSIILIASAISSISIAFATLLNDHPSWKRYLKAKSTFFVCGVCQMFWLSIFVLLTDVPVITNTWLLNSLIIWQSTAFLGFMFRYSFLALFELVKYFYQK